MCPHQTMGTQTAASVSYSNIDNDLTCLRVTLLLPPIYRILSTIGSTQQGKNHLKRLSRSTGCLQRFCFGKSYLCFAFFKKILETCSGQIVLGFFFFFPIGETYKLKVLPHESLLWVPTIPTSHSFREKLARGGQREGIFLSALRGKTFQMLSASVPKVFFNTHPSLLG